MLRLLIRLLGLMLLAGGFISLIVDGTTSFAGGRLYVTTLASSFQTLAPASFAALRAATLAHQPPYVWEAVLAALSHAPLSLSLCAVGAISIVLSHKRRGGVGFLTQ
jgi:hypothetical protein